MKKTDAIFLLLFTLAGRPAAFGQGLLTPPGAPAPTMKTLTQVEPRTAISGGTTAITISQAGSYYLTGNVIVGSGDAINIAATNVTLDLNGFMVATSSGTPSGTGVLVSNINITIGNGTIASTGAGGFINGVATANPTAEGVSVHDLSIVGCAGYGIKLNGNGYAGSRAEHCFVDTTGSNGLFASVVIGCASYKCNGTAISAMEVSDSSGYGSLEGIVATTATNCEGRGGTTGIVCSTATNCSGTSTNTGTVGSGISATTALSCYGYHQAGGIGLNAGTATACKGNSTSGFGLFAVTAMNCYGIIASGIGLQTGTATDCIGSTTSGLYGIYANIFTNSQGVSAGSGAGLGAAFAATNCLGISKDKYGLTSPLATNCFGQNANSSFAALYSEGTANSCRGYNSGGGPAITASIVIGCTTQGGSIFGSKFLGTP